MCVVTSQIHVLLLLWSVCVRVSVCGCLTLSVPGVAGARAGCPEAPVTCKVAKGEWMSCVTTTKKTKKGCWISTIFAGFPTTRGLGVGSVDLVFQFFFGGGGYLLWRRHERAARANPTTIPGGSVASF